ncbi:MAG: family glycosyltransferase [Betaproteobacteria bacterium]|nr:family glycosyltransferase [Betaproteobacteria bacterium]
MIENIGIIVPTYNRHGTLARQLDWLKHIGIQDVVVADGTAQPFPDATRWRHWYRHYPGMSMTQRLKTAAEQIRAPIVTLCPDDDYLCPGGLVRAARLLMEDPGCASAQGRYISIENRRGSLRFGRLYDHAKSFSIDAATPAERLSTWMRSYMHSMYSLRRNDRMLAILRAFPSQVESFNLNELSFAFADAWYGRHFMFQDVLYMARDALVTFAPCPETQDLVRFQANFPERYSRWIQEFTEAFAYNAGAANAGEMKGLWEHAFAMYAEYETLEQRRPMGRLRAIVPPKVKRVLKKLRAVREPDSWIAQTDDFRQVRSHALRFI